MAFFSRFYTKESLLIGVLIVAYLLPIWLFTYFPTQDGVSHVYNSQILTEYNNPEYQFSDYYEINWYPFPNWLSHFSLAVLMFVFPALIAEKIFLSLYVILFPLAIYYFLNAVQRGRQALVILSFTFVYNYLFLMGFYNFAVSVPLFFLALGYWWKHKDDRRRSGCRSSIGNLKGLTSAIMLTMWIIYCCGTRQTYLSLPKRLRRVIH